MKKVSLLLFIIFLAVNVYSQTQQFTFSGVISDKEYTLAVLDHANKEGRIINDSCLLENGAFKFKGEISGPIAAQFTVYKDPSASKNNSDSEFISIFLKPGDNITATGSSGSLRDLTFTGSEIQKEYQALHLQLGKNSDNEEYNTIVKNFRVANKEYRNAKKENKSEVIIDSLDKKVQSIQKQFEPFKIKYENTVRQFAITHPNSYVSAFETSVYVSFWPLNSVKMIYNSFSPAVKNSSWGKTIQKSIADIEKNSANDIAENFTTIDVNGKTISLSDFKGKYVLLDFWASWCVPCRESTPHLIELFKKYNGSGFEVIGVASDDNAQDDWKRAIKKDGTKIWHNVLAGKGKGISKDLIDKFAVGVFPTKILIDKNGMIVERYAGEETKALDKKLAEIFSKAL